MLLTEFDPSEADISPKAVQKRVYAIPKTAITCFTEYSVQKAAETYNGQQIAECRDSNGPIPVYRIIYNGHACALFMSKIGAPTCVAQYEKMWAMGIERIITVGSCGLLDAHAPSAPIIIPTKAYRDEGTSYHYCEPSDFISVNADNRMVDALQGVLNTKHLKYMLGSTWTTDGLFRETQQRVERFKDLGCVCVDMECSALHAAAKYRGKEILQFFYRDDSYTNEGWSGFHMKAIDRMNLEATLLEVALEVGERLRKRVR